LIKADAHLTVSNLKSLDLIDKISAKLGLKANVHLAVNTGMNRFGYGTDNDIKMIAQKIKKSQNINIFGVFSHYFEANNKNFAKKQYDRFDEIKKYLTQEFGNSIIFHIANSDGIIYQNGFDMVRAGMILYSDERFETLTLKSKIIEIQNLESGEFAGYNRTFIAKKNTKLAIVAIGYGDGILRSIAGNGFVLVNEKFSKIVAVCMDSILIDITGQNAKIGDDVVLIGRSGQNKIFICDMARWCDTISYEIITQISKRVKRKYLNKKDKEDASNNRKISCKKIG
jgi:alanine racemase